MDLQRDGQGSPLVLLHSLLVGRRSFEHLVPNLIAYRHVIRPSLPGYGSTPRSTKSIEEVASDLASDLDAAAVVEPIDLLGNGYGGFVALAFAQQFPARVKRLVLLDSAAAFPEQGKEAIRAMKRAVESGGMEAVIPTAAQRLFPAEYAALFPSTVDHWSQALRTIDPIAFASTCQNLIEVDLRAGLSKVTSKTLVVVGLEDKATPVGLAREVAEGIPNAVLVELPGCGHAPHIQAPERLLGILEEFLQAH